MFDPHALAHTLTDAHVGSAQHAYASGQHEAARRVKALLDTRLQERVASEDVSLGGLQELVMDVYLLCHQLLKETT